ncbi:hypothetical protein EZS27_004699 [termite gut metagenome]|uniref:Uncharacterized protein n=1 Tax=termite gut metagenome TaxID=433724 RepID=A0A5J4SNU1_9ZZZZ
MEEILIALLNRIKEKVGERHALPLWIDEDTGQLETDEDTYPVTFPCVLVSNTDTNWTDIGLGVQKGETQLTVKLAIDCYDDTHIGSGTTDKIRERQQLSTEVYKALQGFRVNKYMSAMVRLKSRDYTLPGNIKVYEKIFRFYFHDESAKQGNPIHP